MNILNNASIQYMMCLVRLLFLMQVSCIIIFQMYLLLFSRELIRFKELTLHIGINFLISVPIFKSNLVPVFN